MCASAKQSLPSRRSVPRSMLAWWYNGAKWSYWRDSLLLQAVQYMATIGTLQYPDSLGLLTNTLARDLLWKVYGLSAVRLTKGTFKTYNGNCNFEKGCV
jgi:hypothetical protein